MFGEKGGALKLVEGETMTLLDKDAQFEGKLTFEGQVQIQGKFRGEIFSDGLLVIGEGAEVDAKIEIDRVVIQGTVHGSIQAKSMIEIHPPAVVKGDIASPGLVISKGAVFEGSCSMGQDVAGRLYELPKDRAESTEPQAEDILENHTTHSEEEVTEAIDIL